MGQHKRIWCLHMHQTDEPVHEISNNLMWYVRPAKPQISLRICEVWSEPLLVVWVFYGCYATDWTPFGASKLKRRLQRLARVYTCQNVKFLQISCTGSKDHWRFGPYTPIFLILKTLLLSFRCDACSISAICEFYGKSQLAKYFQNSYALERYGG